MYRKANICSSIRSRSSVTVCALGIGGRMVSRKPFLVPVRLTHKLSISLSGCSFDFIHDVSLPVLRKVPRVDRYDIQPYRGIG
jgi:hypothetical protein